MPTFLVIIHTLFYRLLLFFVFILALPIVAILMILPARIRYQSKILFKAIQVVYWAMIKISFVPVSFKGRENIPSGPVVFAANHQSAADAPLVGVLARGKPNIWLATQHLMTWKLLRWILPYVSIVVDTTSREKAMRSMINLVRLAKNTKADVMIFPEGSRFTDDKVHPFYGGFVTLAKMLERPVVPVYIEGANKVYPPNTFWIQRYPIKVVVGKPFKLQDGESNEAFKNRVYEWFVEQSGK